jgi:hypothetical protein
MVKGETVMPVPEGNITTSDILVPVVEEVVEEVKEETTEDDLPELS